MRSTSKRDLFTLFLFLVSFSIYLRFDVYRVVFESNPVVKRDTRMIPRILKYNMSHIDGMDEKAVINEFIIQSINLSKLSDPQNYSNSFHPFVNLSTNHVSTIFLNF